MATRDLINKIMRKGFLGVDLINYAQRVLFTTTFPYRLSARPSVSGVSAC